MNPLTKLAAKHGLAELGLMEAQAAYTAQMRDAAAEAHAAGVTRYMAQKATGAPVAEVNAWFDGLPKSKPGRRRKNDPVYYPTDGVNV